MVKPAGYEYVSTSPILGIGHGNILTKVQPYGTVGKYVKNVSAQGMKLPPPCRGVQVDGSQNAFSRRTTVFASSAVIVGLSGMLSSSRWIRSVTGRLVPPHSA